MQIQEDDYKCKIDYDFAEATNHEQLLKTHKNYNYNTEYKRKFGPPKNEYEFTFKYALSKVKVRVRMVDNESFYLDLVGKNRVPTMTEMQDTVGVVFGANTTFNYTTKNNIRIITKVWKEESETSSQ